MKDRKAGQLSWLFMLPLLQANTAWYPHSFPDHPHYILRVVQTQQFFWEIFYLYRICVFKLNLFFLVRCVVKLCIIISGFVVVLWFNLLGGAPNEKKEKHIIWNYKS